MVKSREVLGLSDSETLGVPSAEAPEASYQEKGAARISKTWEGLKKGFMGIAKRVKSAAEVVAATPEMVGDAMRAAHERGGEIRQSIVDGIETGVIKVGEPIVEAKARIVNGGRGLPQSRKTWC